jgi:hypothetical protein
MMGDVLSVFRSLIFFIGLIVANAYVLLQRKFGTGEFSQTEAEGSTV